MSQSAGYLLAAVGPMLIGFIIDMTGTWTIPIVFFISLMIGLLICGLKAGDNKIVGEEEYNKKEIIELT